MFHLKLFLTNLFLPGFLDICPQDIHPWEPFHQAVVSKFPLLRYNYRSLRNAISLLKSNSLSLNFPILSPIHLRNYGCIFDLCAETRTLFLLSCSLSPLVFSCQIMQIKLISLIRLFLAFSLLILLPYYCSIRPLCSL